MSYFEKLLATELTLKPGTVQHVGVFHDDDCGIFAGGPCTCDADVKVLDGPMPLKWSQDFRRRCRERRKAKAKANRQ
ncbi:hypothetical protein [Desulfomicrobium escambiense]|uniref:hypothetical protein n=1 Tax=Desulfomicrobium escambiense TaxID=29503 RepID=UPI00041EA225|nr:hypothetical protein [Desulfomicrobium escambiense]